MVDGGGVKERRRKAVKKERKEAMLAIVEDPTHNTHTHIHTDRPFWRRIYECFFFLFLLLV
jgi:hypothetical protein